MSKHQKRITLAQGLAALYEQTAQRVRDGVRSAATLDMQRAHGRWLAAELGTRARLASIDETTLEHLTAPRVPPRRFGPSTMRKRLSTLRQLLALAHRRRWVSRVPAWPVVIAPWRPRGRFLERFEDARRIAAELPPHRADWFWLCLLTGQHASDVERMTWADLSDLHNRSAGREMCAAMLIRNTKNRKVAGLRVPAPRHLVVVLRALWKRARPRPGDKLVRPWPSRKHTLPLVCYRLGLPPMNAIDLRHTCATWMVRRLGITPAVCAWFGHSSPAMMARTYAHALPAQLGECARELDSVCEPPAGGAAAA